MTHNERMATIVSGDPTKQSGASQSMTVWVVMSDHGLRGVDCLGVFLTEPSPEKVKELDDAVMISPCYVEVLEVVVSP